jgi:hypothetical protein
MARVKFEHVYKRFGKVEVVHDINLDVKDKEFLVLVGPIRLWQEYLPAHGRRAGGSDRG